MFKIFLIFPLLLFSSASHAALLTGTWTNTSFNSNGDVSFDINVALPAISIIADFDGPVFGQGNPPPVNIPGTVIGNVASISLLGDNFFGDISGTLNSNGPVNILIENLPLTGATPTGANIFSTELAGSITSDNQFNISEVDLSYLVIFNCDNSGGSSACPGPDEMGVEGMDYALGVITATIVPIPAAFWMFTSALMMLSVLRRKSRA